MTAYAPSPEARAEEAAETLADIHRRLLGIYDELNYATSLISNPEAALPWADLQPNVMRLAHAVMALKTALGRTPPERKAHAIKEYKRVTGPAST